MQGSSLVRHSENQATWPKFIIWIILYDYTIVDCFPQFLHTDMPNDTLVYNMTREFKLVTSDLLTNFLYHRLLL
jgi:hypothetical protein